ncbi:unnamed protein product [Orchesella dallaii]|uniref:Gustatory receptor n=1 Tax=Orchesella dallaii TaxID=48710 RepID=A0ABP1PUW3_9HEXA
MEYQVAPVEPFFNNNAQFEPLPNPAIVPEYRLKIPFPLLQKFFLDARNLAYTNKNQLERYHFVYVEILMANANLVDLHHRLAECLDYIIRKRELTSNSKPKAKLGTSSKKDLVVQWLRLRASSLMKSMFVTKRLKEQRESANEKEITELGRKVKMEINRLVCESNRVGKLMETFLKDAQLSRNREFVDRMNQAGLLAFLSATHESTGLLLKFLPPNDCAADSFLKGLKPVISVGRLLGVFSERDISCEREGLRCSKFERLHSGSLILFFLINFIFQSMANLKRFESHETTSPKLQELVLPGYSFTLFFMFAYISFNTRKLQALIKKLSDISREFSATQIQRSTSVSTYPRFCLILLMVILIYGILENLAYDIQAFSTVLLKVGTYGWIFGDILTIVLCRVLSERLQDIRNEIQTLIDCVPDELISITEVIPNQGNKTKRLSVPWNDIRRQYLALSDLVREVGKFISPLILSCYGINVYLITINV